MSVIACVMLLFVLSPGGKAKAAPKAAPGRGRRAVISDDDEAEED